MADLLSQRMRGMGEEEWIDDDGRVESDGDDDDDDAALIVFDVVIESIDAR